MFLLPTPWGWVVVHIRKSRHSDMYGATEEPFIEISFNRIRGGYLRAKMYLFNMKNGINVYKEYRDDS